ncbi:hypothetical protein Hanom_Chr08g00713821 [Helianthus anomalus]
MVVGIGTEFTELGTFLVPIHYRLLTFLVPVRYRYFPVFTHKYRYRTGTYFWGFSVPVSTDLIPSQKP